MGGTLEYGAEDKVVINETPEVVSAVIDARDQITVTELPESVLDAVVADGDVYASVIPATNFDIIVETSALDLIAVFAPYTPTEYESTLLMLYQQYGQAQISKTLFISISDLVNVQAPDATYGIV